MPSHQLNLLAFLCTSIVALLCLIMTLITYIRQRRYEQHLQAAWKKAEEDKQHREEIRRAMAKFMEFKTGHEQVLTGAHQHRTRFAQGMRDRFQQSQRNDSNDLQTTKQL